MAEQHRKPLLVMTGSSGLLGKRISEALTDSYRIVGLDLVEPENPVPGVEWRPCDLTVDDSVDEAMEGVRADHGDHIASVIHLAAYYDFSGEPSPLYNDLTVDGTQRMLNALAPFTVEQFVFSSSLLVMEPTASDDAPLTEESPTRAEWAYPESKLNAEAVLREHHGDIPLVILRIAGVYDDDCNSIPIGNHIARVHGKKIESFLFPGDKSHGQPFIHLDDLVECFVKTVERRGDLDSEETFLIAESGVLSHDELQDLIGQHVHGMEWPTIRVPKTVAKAGAWAKEMVEREEAFIKPWMIDLADDNYPVAIMRACTRLDWEPQHNLRDTLPEMIARMKKDPDAWYDRNGIPMPSSVESGKS